MIEIAHIIVAALYVAIGILVIWMIGVYLCIAAGIFVDWLFGVYPEIRKQLKLKDKQSEKEQMTSDLLHGIERKQRMIYHWTLRTRISNPTKEIRPKTQKASPAETDEAFGDNK